MALTRLKYANLSEKDSDDLYNCLSGPEVSEPIYWLKTPFTKEDAKSLVDRAICEQLAQTDYWLAARQKPGGSYVGNINIHLKDKGEAEIGYWVSRDFWNNGYASEMIGYAVLFAEKLKGINHLTATTALENIGSQTVLLRNGFEYESTITSKIKVGKVRRSKLYKRRFK